MRMPFAALAAVVAAEWLLDTSNSRWEDEWDFVAQTGADTGNDELQDYRPSQCQQGVNGSLALLLQRSADGRFASGKIRSKRSLVALAPNGGIIELLFLPPENTFRNEEGTTWAGSFAPGLWPAVWLTPRDDVSWPTGGEIDLVELMHRAGSPCSVSAAFSTLHFGPRPGVDAIYDGQWGLSLARFDLGNGVQSMNFSWQRTTAGSWLMEQWVNGARVWKQETAYVDRFLDFERGKRFQNARSEDFAKGAAGDPAKIFQKAFDAAPFHININLAFGGAPFGVVDRTLSTSSFRLVRFRLWGRVRSP